MDGRWNMKQFKECPTCKIPWEEEETIYEHFLHKTGQSSKARAIAEMYGDTEENPQHFGKNVMGIYDDKNDRVSHWMCTNCESLFDRFTMEKINK